MNSTEIIEGNKLIAEFEYNTNDWNYLNSKLSIFESELKYHSSWDLLMPIVEKIEHMSNYTRKDKVYFHDFSFVPAYVDINVEFKINGKNSSIFVFEFLQCADYMQKIYFQFDSLNISELSKTDTKTWRTKIENCYMCVVEFIKYYNKQKQQ